MPDEISGGGGKFRDQLLDAQQTTPTLREEYRRELDAVVNHRLTPATRAFMWLGAIVSAVFAVFLLRALLVHHEKAGVKLIMPVYLAVAVAAVVWFARVLWQGGFARRTSALVGEVLGGTVVAVYVTATLLQGMRVPTDPASLFGAVLGVMVLVIGFAWGTGSRIAMAKLETREHLLRIESRLADLSEKMAKGQ